MAKSKGITKISVPKGPSFVRGSRPPDLYAPRIAPRLPGNILAKPPRIAPLQGQTNYGKVPAATQTQDSFGNTGLTNES